MGISVGEYFEKQIDGYTSVGKQVTCTCAKLEVPEFRYVITEMCTRPGKEATDAAVKMGSFAICGNLQLTNPIISAEVEDFLRDVESFDLSSPDRYLCGVTITAWRLKGNGYECSFIAERAYIRIDIPRGIVQEMVAAHNEPSNNIEKEN